MRITILVGTMTGTAELVAQEVEQVLQAAGYAPRIAMMEAADASVFEGGGVFLVVSSTYGNGDVPDNAKALYEHLQQTRPDLSHVRYGVFGLGDRTYAETFNFGGKRFDEILADIDPRNDASLRLLKRLGFRRTGFAQRTIEVAGVWCDSIYLQLPHDERG